MPQTQVNFAWDANPPAQNVTNYILSRGVQTTQYTDSFNMGNNLTGFDTITVSGTYFWTLTAQNGTGISPLSLELTEFVFVPQPASPGPARMVVG